MMNYRQALQATDDAVWQRLQPAQKLEALQAIEDEMAARQGRQARPLVAKDLESETLCGYYSPKDRQITLNSRHFEPGSPYGACEEMVDTVLHEGRHSYQHQAVNGEIWHERLSDVQAWQANMDSYVTFEENPRRYAAQPLEADARSFAQSQRLALGQEREIQRGLGQHTMTVENDLERHQ